MNFESTWQAEEHVICAADLMLLVISCLGVKVHFSSYISLVKLLPVWPQTGRQRLCNFNCFFSFPLTLVRLPLP